MTPEDLQHRRELVLELLDVATDGALGMPEGAFVYDEITERRDRFKAYSSCADLCHWMLFRVGVRLPLINREEHRGWRPIVNLARLAEAPMARKPRAGEVFQAGDILVIYNDEHRGLDAHVMVVRQHVADTIHTADYGQPGGARRTRTLRNGILGDRKLQRVVPLISVLDVAERTGALTDPEAPGDWLARVFPPGVA